MVLMDATDPQMDNAKIKEEMKRLDVVWHFNTTGHPYGRDSIEILHSDHLRVYQAERGLELDSESSQRQLKVKDVEEIKISSIVYRKISSNRGKEILRYEGPFKVVVIREHNIVTIESLHKPCKRKTIHVEQLKRAIVPKKEQIS